MSSSSFHGPRPEPRVVDGDDGLVSQSNDDDEDEDSGMSSLRRLLRDQESRRDSVNGAERRVGDQRHHRIHHHRRVASDQRRINGENSDGNGVSSLRRILDRQDREAVDRDGGDSRDRRSDRRKFAPDDREDRKSRPRSSWSDGGGNRRRSIKQRDDRRSQPRSSWGRPVEKPRDDGNNNNNNNTSALSRWSDNKKRSTMPSPPNSPHKSSSTSTSGSSTSTSGSSSIESLRAIFLESVEIDRKRREERKAREQRTTSGWRTNRIDDDEDVDNGEGVRKRATLSPAEQHKAELQQRLNFFSTHEDQERQRRDRRRLRRRAPAADNEEKSVTLPTNVDTMELRGLANLLRVAVPTIAKTLVELGQLDASVLRNDDDNDNDNERSRTAVASRVVDVDTAELVAMELGFLVEHEEAEEDARLVVLEGDAAAVGRRHDDAVDNKRLVPRPPVVSIMGHVDHGKTTLMDALRRRSLETFGNASADQKKQSKKKKKKKGKENAAHSHTNVAGTEAGGITQVITAFQVPLVPEDETSTTVLDDVDVVTFLDTPGHAAFRSMRRSGSAATDVLVLVVAADDGVSEQTIEILDTYRDVSAALGPDKVAVVVAVTKIDRPGVDADEAVDRIRNQLASHGLPNSESVELIPLSAITGEGLDDLVEALVLQARTMELRADPVAAGEGVVLDARMDKRFGVVVDCVVRWGSMKRGDVAVSGTHVGRIRTLTDVRGRTVGATRVSQPVRVTGMRGLPNAGDPILIVEDEETANEIVEQRLAKSSGDDVHEHRANDDDNSNNTMELQITGASAKRRRPIVTSPSENDGVDSDRPVRVPVVVKADADGTLRAVRESLVAVGPSSRYDLVVDPVDTGIGPVTPSDLALARESGATVFLFNVPVSEQDRRAAELAGVELRRHDVIYSLLDAAKEVFAERYLPKEEHEVVHGRAVVRTVFELNSNNRSNDVVAGLRVREGSLYRDRCERSGTPCRYRITRNDGATVVGEGVPAASLRRVKDDVTHVKKGEECGLGLEAFSDLREGDTIECYSTEMRAVKL